jgi:hypothetical protein
MFFYDTYHTQDSLYMAVPLSMGDTFQEPLWMHEMEINTEPSVYEVFFLYLTY